MVDSWVENLAEHLVEPLVDNWDENLAEHLVVLMAEKKACL